MPPLVSHGRLSLLRKFVVTIPEVKRELANWATMAKKMPEPLRTQALLSIEHKAFHCIGGSVYAHYPGADKTIVIKIIVALQTISDYLDNLCDRLQVNEPNAFRWLHKSMLHAVSPGTPLDDYYLFYPHSETVYLVSLVQVCQELLTEIPYYAKVQPHIVRLVEKYTELQVLKHVTPNGQELLENWVNNQLGSELLWNELAAACGSTLGMFFLIALAYIPPDSTLELGLACYFPWIQGYHILLDYLIDLKEDAAHGDLNFVVYYPSKAIRECSLSMFAQKSKQGASSLPNAYFHKTVVDGLLALYGSDPKVKDQQLQGFIQQLAGHGLPLFMLKTCQTLRKLGIL